MNHLPKNFNTMTRSEQSQVMFAQYAVKGCKSVAQFLERFYRHERYTGRGADYAASLLSSYESEFAALGICWISHHDSVTGNAVSFFPTSSRGKQRQERGSQALLSGCVSPSDLGMSGQSAEAPGDVWEDKIQLPLFAGVTA